MQEHLKVAYTKKALELFAPIPTRKAATAEETDFTDIAALVVTEEDESIIHDRRVKAFHIPLFLIVHGHEERTDNTLGHVYGMIDTRSLSRPYFERQIEQAASSYEDSLLPPFFKTLKNYVDCGNAQFDCPGHQGGAYFRKHPAGRIFYDFYGENTFRGDLCNADVAMGDLLIHEGAALAAQKHAARVFNADKAYFILNGTSGANKVVMNALLTPGDLVLYERNNHKSVGYGALIQAGAIPIYLETARNPFGLIGGVLDHCFNEEYIRMLIAERDPRRARMDRPLRAAVIQLGNYDGCIYNARQVVEKSAISATTLSSIPPG